MRQLREILMRVVLAMMMRINGIKGMILVIGMSSVAWDLVFDEISTCRNEVVNTGY